MPGFGVPQLQGDDLADSPAGEPAPAAGFVGAEIQGPNQLEGPSQRRGSRRVALRETPRERVEQDIGHPRRVGTWRRAERSLGGRARAARDVQVAGPHRGLPEGLPVCFTRSGGVERLETAGRAEQQPGCVAAAPLVQRDLPAHVLYFRGLQLAQRAGLDRGQQPQRRIQRASVAFGPRRRK